MFSQSLLKRWVRSLALMRQRRNPGSGQWSPGCWCQWRTNHLIPLAFTDAIEKIKQRRLFPTRSFTSIPNFPSDDSQHAGAADSRSDHQHPAIPQKAGSFRKLLDHWINGSETIALARPFVVSWLLIPNPSSNGRHPYQPSTQ